MFTELKQQISGQLTSHLYGLYEKTKNNYFTGCRYVLEDGETSDIIRLWMRGLFHREIALIREKTVCESLCKYLGDVVHLPSIEKSNF